MKHRVELKGVPKTTQTFCVDGDRRPEEGPFRYTTQLLARLHRDASRKLVTLQDAHVDHSCATPGKCRFCHVTPAKMRQLEDYIQYNDTTSLTDVWNAQQALAHM